MEIKYSFHSERADNNYLFNEFYRQIRYVITLHRRDCGKTHNRRNYLIRPGMLLVLVIRELHTRQWPLICAEWSNSQSIIIGVLRCPGGGFVLPVVYQQDSSLLPHSNRMRVWPKELLQTPYFGRNLFARKKRWILKPPQGREVCGRWK